MNYEFVLSPRGNNVLSYEGYTYSKDKQISEKTHWRCTEYHKRNCSARCTITNGILSLTPNTHNHAPDIAKIQARKVVSLIKINSRFSIDTPQNIISSNVVGLPQAVIGCLPSIATIKKSIQRVRTQIAAPLPNPSSLLNLIIPNSYQLTLTGTPFLLFDSGPSEERILLFSTSTNLDILFDCQDWLCDGTFKTTPLLFTQLYTIHCNYNNHIIPVVYLLLPNKTSATYNTFLSVLRHIKPGLNPRSILIDFEMAAINSISFNFPNALIQGCYYHFSQSFWRKVQANSDILERYSNDSEFSLNCKMMLALAFVPLVNVVSAFEQLQASEYYQSHIDILATLLDYFEDTYIGRPVSGSTRRSPRFKHSLWNCYDATRLGKSRTNNSVEGWHNGFARSLNCYHPGIWQFIAALQREQGLNEFRIGRIRSGEPVNSTRRIYRDLNSRLKTLVVGYLGTNHLEYLAGIAQNIGVHT